MDGIRSVVVMSTAGGGFLVGLVLVGKVAGVGGVSWHAVGFSGLSRRCGGGVLVCVLLMGLYPLCCVWGVWWPGGWEWLVF